MAGSVGIDRGQVIAVAARLADEGGLDQLTLAQVAKQLGVKLPSLYHHIDGVPALRRELALLGLGQLRQAMQRATMGKSGDAAIMAMAQAYRAYAGAHPGLYAATVRAPLAADAEWEQAAREIIAVMLAILEPYHLSDAAAIHAIRGLRSIVHGFVSVESGGGFEMALDRDESFGWLMRAYIAGLRASG
jgi:AcrR family transcriptional regulator